VVVNREMARRYWPGGAVGRRISLEGPDGPWLTIVGVVGNVHHFGLGSDIEPEFYASYLQDPWPAMTVVIRTDIEPEAVAPAVRQEIRTIDRDLPIAEMRTLEQLVAASLGQPRFELGLMGAFAFLALTLAAVGLYGTTAYTVGMRAHEISVRMSLGAARRAILGLVLGEVFRLALAGLVLGLAASFVLNRFLASLLFEVGAADPAVFAGVSVALLAVALLAGWLPAHRASRTHPAVVLRSP
jgi:predicted lysophospholipase L1 biosynthesis ABC-type transport system permease subunit